LLSKQNVNGSNRSPLWQFLLASPAGGSGKDIDWNFGKVLVDRKGVVRLRVDPGTLPDAPAVTKVIEELLAESA